MSKEVVDIQSMLNPDMLAALQAVNKRATGGSKPKATNRRISLRGGKFRMIENGEQVAVSKSDSIEVVIINAASVSRTFYASTYDPDKAAAPTCWSADTNTPASDVPEDQRQAARCNDCPQHVRGSGAGGGRACRFSQRIAVAFSNRLDEIYQLQLPATSVFGDARGGNMPFKAYAQFLSQQGEGGTPLSVVVTEIYFDEDSDTPKLFFKPVRGISNEEAETVFKMVEHPDTMKAITLTVSQTDGVQKIEAPKPVEVQQPKASVRKNAIEDEPEAEVEEPKKMAKKSPPPEASEESLSDVIDSWDD
jgi:hypothetical protein